MSARSLTDLLESTYLSLKARLPEKLLTPEVGIVCGSGLSNLADSLKEAVMVQYSDLEGFGTSTGTKEYRTMNLDTEMDLRFPRRSSGS